MGESLAVTRGGSVAVLTIDRSGKRNAMTAGMWAALPGVSARRPTILASAR
jgi:enoyl-CoA hydratase/carnithine racemase